MSAQQILAQELNLIIQDLKAHHIELGMLASGKWVESLVEETTPSVGRIFAEDYTEFLVDGRGPGTGFTADEGRPPIQKIKDWIEAKGISAGDVSVTSLAFAIANKIAAVGTQYFQDGGTDLIDFVITPARIDQIIKRVGEEMMLELIFKLERTFAAVA